MLRKWCFVVKRVVKQVDKFCYFKIMLYFCTTKQDRGVEQW